MSVRVTMKTNNLESVNGNQKEAFARRLLQILNDGSLALMISIGHQLDLFNALARRSPLTVRELARATRLKEKYLQEWLGAMVTGKIVNYNPKTGTYRLLPERAVSLTHQNQENLALYMQFIPLLGNVEQNVIQCFRKGGGVPYSAYPLFHRVMAEESGQLYNKSLTKQILGLAPGLVGRLREGIDAADVGCGSGRAINLMAAAFSESRFCGYDFSKKAIGAARAEALRLKLPNARFEVRDAAALNLRRRYHLITAFNSIHDQAKPAQVLKSIHQALRPGGIFLMVETTASSYVHKNLNHPIGPFLYTRSTLHCMTVSLAQKGAGLGTVWGEEKTRQMLQNTGFSPILTKQIPGDIFNNFYIAAKAGK